jgi:hypothetical protein
MLRYIHIVTIKTKDSFISKSLVHYEGPFNDHALCGQDLSGDSIGTESWTVGKPTKKRVNCQDCIRFRNHVLGKLSDHD